MKIRSDSMVGSDSYRDDQSFSDSEVGHYQKVNTLNQ